MTMYLLIAIGFVAGWFCCSYFEQQVRIDRAKARRRHPAASPSGLAGYDPLDGHWFDG